MTPFRVSLLNLLSFFLVRLSQQSVASRLDDPSATTRRNKSQPAVTEAAVRVCTRVRQVQGLSTEQGEVCRFPITLPAPPAPQAGRFLPHGESVPYAVLFCFFFFP